MGRTSSVSVRSMRTRLYLVGQAAHARRLPRSDRLPRESPADRQTMIGLLGRTFDRLARRVGYTTTGVVVLAMAGVVWLSSPELWATGELRVAPSSGIAVVSQRASRCPERSVLRRLAAADGPAARDGRSITDPRSKRDPLYSSLAKSHSSPNPCSPRVSARFSLRTPSRSRTPQTVDRISSRGDL
jgi:hypothetical protein